MLGNSLASPLLTLDSATRFSFSSPDFGSYSPNLLSSNGIQQTASRGPWTSISTSNKKWETHSTAKTKTGPIVLNDEEKKTWDLCKQTLTPFKFSAEEEDKILGKAFGHAHSPYWGEAREREVPKFEVVNEILNYLRSLSLTDDDLCKLLKKFPEVIGCDLEDEVKNNVKVLEIEWGIKGKSLKSLLLRNPKVLGYNVDCKGDCMAQCTRCWVRF